MIKKVEVIVGEDCIFVINILILLIIILFEVSVCFEQFIGIYFFSFVDKMMLVEIIKGKVIGDCVVVKVFDFVCQIKKILIVVNDEWFFYVNCCIILYINEGICMVCEGVEFVLIENVVKLVGMFFGLFQFIDEILIDFGVKIVKVIKVVMGDVYLNVEVDDVFFLMFDQGCLGCKLNSGFYVYDDKGKCIGLWDGLGE